MQAFRLARRREYQAPEENPDSKLNAAEVARLKLYLGVAGFWFAAGLFTGWVQ